MWHGHMEPMRLTYRKISRGFTFSNLTRNFKFHQYIIGYFDDSTLILIFREDQSTTTAFNEAHEALTSGKNIERHRGRFGFREMHLLIHGLGI